MSNDLTARRPIRLWPGIVLAGFIVLVRLLMPLIVENVSIYGVLGGVAGGAAVIVWWLFFSRAPWGERLLALAVMLVAAAAMFPLLHESIRNGFMGRMFPLFATPAAAVALVAWAAASRSMSKGPRMAALVAAAVMASGVFTLLRTDGIDGDANSDLEWRWTPSAEERLLAMSPALPAPAPAPPASVPAATVAVTPTSGTSTATAAAASPTKEKSPESPRPTDTSAAAPAAADAADARAAAWPGFRGPNRDGVVRGARVAADWASSPPVQMWRRPIGPGWSSFAVDGDFVYTQEQRGEHEVLSCYRLATGEPVWAHQDTARFYESNGGAGPRGTPAVHGGRVFALGATGVMNALDARTGVLVWSRNAQADTGAPMPGWGFAASPLVVGDRVIVAASGRLAAYDVATGTPRWTRATGGGGYASPHLATLGGIQQVLLLSGGGITSVSPADGAVLWQHTWAEGIGFLQPVVLGEGDLLITAGDMMGGVGTRRLAVARGPDGWSVTEKWTTRGLKPYFNDVVAHEGHAYGFDGSILSCIDLATGDRRWKGGRYGHGQVVLLPDQDALLVLSEEGELALVSAMPDKFTELARFKAIEGKTWNHPVLIGDVLLVRNGEEMAAFRLPRR